MKTLFVLLFPIVLILTAFPLPADDGSWNRSFDIAGGAVYSEVDNAEITLEKELLVFDGSTTRAVFLFRNTTDRPVTTACGFPVVIDYSAWFHNDGWLSISMGKYGSRELPGMGHFETIPHPWLEEDEPMFDYPRVIPVTPANNRREFIAPSAAAAAGIDFAIYQDGEKIEVDQVLLERRADKEGASLTFHFKHDLDFAAGAESIVEVLYSQELVDGSNGPGMTTYRWDYVIGTGGTWKGSMKEFFFIKPSFWSGEVEGMEQIRLSADFTGLSSDMFPREFGFDLYYSGNYEPPREAEFNLRHSPLHMANQYQYFDFFPQWMEMWRNRHPLREEESHPAQRFVKSPGSSSFLPDRVDVFTDTGAIKSAGFGPAAAFDGLPETAWCEAVSGDGIGEYLEVRLEEVVHGIALRNGFTRFPAPDWIFDQDFFISRFADSSLGIKDYFTLNNRIKTLEIQREDGGVIAVLEAADMRDSQFFGGFKLDPGTYRFIIREIYPGTRWKDTCLGEITFLQPDNSSTAGGVLDRLYTDDFFSENMGAIRFLRQEY